MKLINKIILFPILILIALIFISFLYSYYVINKKCTDKAAIEIIIPQNTTVAASIDILNSNGLLEPELFFKTIARIYAKYEKKRIFAGHYTFTSNNSNLDILKSLFSGKQLNVIKVTFPEGISYHEFADILFDKLEIDKTEFLKLCKSDSLLRRMKIDADNVEGYLMPNTYEFYKKQNAYEIITKLLETQSKLWNKKFATRAKELDMSRLEILTLASIIEAETPIPSERAKVSGVYHNRLRMGMPLQADPTVQYSINSKHKLTSRDLHSNSPYNTYKFPGLPPGPINCPGEASIEAALNPEYHDYIYFVAKGDSSNTHNFASTPAGHKLNIAKYKKNRKRNSANN
jgi:UPF0755 protein